MAAKQRCPLLLTTLASTPDKDLTHSCHLNDSCQIYTTWTDDITCPFQMCQEEWRGLLEGHQETPGHISKFDIMFHLQQSNITSNDS